MKSTLSITSVLFFSLLLITGCSDSSEEKETKKYKYDYETVEGDPFEALIYTLDNGLKIYMSVNEESPRIQTNIAIKAGSKQDPADATGLAHYLEHMLFKGTSNIGTTDWEKERVLHQEISDLYEERRTVTDPDIRKQIYKKIDSLSNKAAEIAIANEYDKMVSSLGAQGTNAYTSHEQTVYVNDIPSNEIEKWLKLESERFSELVLRLFHTELETVYEEFNMGQDNDYRIAYKALMENMFKKHNYGLQTTIGEGEHLKNPSMEKIHEYFNTYYVPNNMAIVLAGDLDPDETVELIEKYFGEFEPKDVPEYTFEPEDEITEPVIKDVFGQDREFLNMAFRTEGSHSDDAMLLELVGELLNNGKAGLIDLNINQQQKALNAYAYSSTLKDYGWLMLSASPKEDQSLEDLRSLLLEQLDKLKKGDFDDWLIDAAIKNMKVRDIRIMEYNFIRVSTMTSAFVEDLEWEKLARKYDRLENVTKEDVVAYANKTFKDNYIAINKKTGKADVEKVEKPEITPLDIDRDVKSEFLAEFEAMESPRIEPVFLDYDELIHEEKLSSGVSFSYIENTTNELASLSYILDMGSDHDKELSIALEYLPYLGTSKYSPEELQEEFFKLGLNYGVNASNDRSYVWVSGLEESLEDGVKLLEHILEDVVENNEAYEELINDKIKKRADNKLNKGYILFNGMFNYARFGEENHLRNKLHEEELRNIEPTYLTDKIKNIPNYNHRIFYYGTQKADDVVALLEKHHKVPEAFVDYPEETKYTEIETEENEVYFVDYDMVQTQVIMYSKGPDFDRELMPYAQMFNSYFGSGLSSIVFQEIRETKALAYSAYSYFGTPRDNTRAHYIRSFVGTQTDKLEEALDAMLDLMNDMPESNKQYNDSKLSTLKKIETNRITGESIFWNYEAAKRKGFETDPRAITYKTVESMEIEDLRTFFNENIKGEKYKFLVIGSSDSVDKEMLKKFGAFKELTLEDVFGY